MTVPSDQSPPRSTDGKPPIRDMRITADVLGSPGGVPEAGDAGQRRGHRRPAGRVARAQSKGRSYDASLSLSWDFMKKNNHSCIPEAGDGLETQDAATKRQYVQGVHPQDHHFGGSSRRRRRSGATRRLKRRGLDQRRTRRCPAAELPRVPQISAASETGGSQ